MEHVDDFVRSVLQPRPRQRKRSMLAQIPAPSAFGRGDVSCSTPLPVRSQDPFTRMMSEGYRLRLDRPSRTQRPKGQFAGWHELAMKSAAASQCEAPDAYLAAVASGAYV
jgi:hypothetical protein